MKFRGRKHKVLSNDVDVVLQLAAGRSLASFVDAAQAAVGKEVGAAQEIHGAAVAALMEASQQQQVALTDLNVAEARAAIVARVAAAQ